ncbi:cell wall protein DAN4 isoform X2 [Silurus meridionalis]|uniref:cell wall protein DAN4 isoform X2 n=1 Tax=Silurus meridionalis TaxID=175797 RepID=UPI001EEAB717|nr:cell wall protein DAN4 isoform X2 [Silurus meridionalis]
MKETIALCMLLLFCFSSFIEGEDDLNSPARLLNFTTPSTSSSPQRSSTAKPESFSSPTLNASSKGDLSVNTTRSQSFNDTTDSTVAPGADEPRLNTLAPINSTTVLGNLTDAQDDLSVGNNQTSTISSTSFTTTNTTNTPLPGPITTTSAPTLSQSLSSTTGPQITTSPSATTTQSRGNSTTVTTKDTASAPTTRTISTTTTTTTAQAKSVDSSELNVGDDTEYSVTSMDPLLVGLVSVFVVTAAVVSLLIFLKFRRRNERPEFRRLQDLPMDDMMEDTPLSMYSY